LTLFSPKAKSIITSPHSRLDLASISNSNHNGALLSAAGAGANAVKLQTK
jgi:hypothetical protein